MTVDARGCQKAIAPRLLDRQADSLLVLKANPGHAHEAVQNPVDFHCFHRGAALRPRVETFDDSPGRRVHRRVLAGPTAATLAALSNWPGLHTVLAIAAIRSMNGRGQGEAETRSCRSSFTADPQGLAQASRRHGSMENRLHGVRDVTGREDDSRGRDPMAARNLARLRKRALTLVG